MEKIDTCAGPCTVTGTFLLVGEGKGEGCQGWGGQGLHPPMAGPAWPD